MPTHSQLTSTTIEPPPNRLSNPPPPHSQGRTGKEERVALEQITPLTIVFPHPHPLLPLTPPQYTLIQHHYPSLPHSRITILPHNHSAPTKNPGHLPILPFPGICIHLISARSMQLPTTSPEIIAPRELRSKSAALHWVSRFTPTPGMLPSCPLMSFHVLQASKCHSTTYGVYSMYL